MKKKFLAILAIFFLVIVTTSAFAQPSAPSDQGARPGPGYGAGPDEGYGYGPGYGYGMGPWMMGPGMMGPGWGGYGMGPWMMGPGWGHGYGMGPGMMGRGYGPGYGYGMGLGMMGPGYGYGPGGGQPYSNLSPEERESRAKAFVEEYLRRNLPGYSLEKKQQPKKK